MDKIKDNPGVNIPPPILFLAVFILGILLQRLFPVNKEILETRLAGIIGILCVLISMIFGLAALNLFFKSNTTVLTMKPAVSLQTEGVYRFSRNPMYVGVLLFYIGISFFWGNLWNFILSPVLFLLLQEYVIVREEKYLTRRFGEDYKKYRSKVRRWL